MFPRIRYSVVARCKDWEGDAFRAFTSIDSFGSVSDSTRYAQTPGKNLWKSRRVPCRESGHMVGSKAYPTARHGNRQSRMRASTDTTRRGLKFSPGVSVTHLHPTTTSSHSNSSPMDSPASSNTFLPLHDSESDPIDVFGGSSPHSSVSTLVGDDTKKTIRALRSRQTDPFRDTNGKPRRVVKRVRTMPSLKTEVVEPAVKKAKVGNVSDPDAYSSSGS